MSQYRKKPVVIEASQWHKNGDHPQDYSKTHDGLENGELRQFLPEERRANGWEGDIVRYYRHPDDSGMRACQHCGNTMHVHGWIDTKEGGHIVCPGDWIITGVQGEHYPCKPDIFAATYEPACAQGAASTTSTDPAEEIVSIIGHCASLPREEALVKVREVLAKHDQAVPAGTLKDAAQALRDMAEYWTGVNTDETRALAFALGYLFGQARMRREMDARLLGRGSRHG